MGSQSLANEEAYSDGHAARRKGKGTAFNPHSGTSLWAHWNDGWRAADQAIEAGDPMNSQQLEDAADDTRSIAEDRTEALDQREADLAGKIQTLEAERDELLARATAATRELGLEPITLSEAAASGRIEHLEAELSERDEDFGRAVRRQRAMLVIANKRIADFEIQVRLSKEETASMAKTSCQWQARVANTERQLADAEAKKLTWMRLHDEAEKQVSIRLDAATELVSKVEEERDALRCALVNVEGRTRYVMLSCENILRLIQALEPKGETDGDSSGM